MRARLQELGLGHLVESSFETCKSLIVEGTDRLREISERAGVVEIKAETVIVCYDPWHDLQWRMLVSRRGRGIARSFHTGYFAKSLKLRPVLTKVTANLNTTPPLNLRQS